jgi:hypothetical protein
MMRRRHSTITTTAPVAIAEPSAIEHGLQLVVDTATTGTLAGTRLDAGTWRPGISSGYQGDLGRLQFAPGSVSVGVGTRRDGLNPSLPSDVVDLSPVQRSLMAIDELDKRM